MINKKVMSSQDTVDKMKRGTELVGIPRDEGEGLTTIDVMQRMEILLG